MADLLMALGFLGLGGAWTLARGHGRRSFRFPWECSHRRTSFPQRPRDTRGPSMASCLECGESLDYQKLTRCEWINR